MKVLLMQQIDLPGLEDVQFTATQFRIMSLLLDGEPKHKRDVLACLPDDMGEMSTIRVHLTYIRRKIRPKGYTILVDFDGRIPRYRLVQTLNSSD